MPRAVNAFMSKESLALFEKHEVMSHKEVEARNEIKLENYIKKVQIEARVIGTWRSTISFRRQLPIRTSLLLMQMVLKGLGVDNKAVVKTIKEISGHIDISQGTSIK